MASVMKSELGINSSIHQASQATVCGQRPARREMSAALPRSRWMGVLALLTAFSLPACAGASEEDAAESTIEEPSEVTDTATPGDGVVIPAASAHEAPLAAPEAEPSAPEADPQPVELQASPAAASTTSAASSASEAPEASAPPTAEAAPATASAAPAAPTKAATMRTSGRQLLDACGNVFVVRGVEQAFGEQLPQGNDWVGLIEQIAASGVNAVRILAGTDTLALEDVDALLGVVADHEMVAYVTPYGNEATAWLEGADVRAMLAKHEKYIIIDAFGEPTFDDRARFVADATSTIQRVRSWGYRVPLTVTANQFGRDLPSLLELGSQIVAADPLNNTILGWQAYWSTTGYYQERYGMSAVEGVRAAARAPFPIQLGLDRVTDFPSSATADYGALLAATEEHGIGWLWWDWYNPYGNENNLTHDGSATNLTATGSDVLHGHAASVARTAKRACR